MQHIRTILFLCLVHPFVSTSQNCLKTTLYFNSGKENLKKNQLLVLDSLLNGLHPDSTYLIELHGHTDDRGTEEDNMKLSQSRVKYVETVINTYENLKLVRLRLSFGELSPASKENKLNRRVSIYVLPVNDDGTLTVYGDNGVQMRTPVGFFSGCGICLSNPTLDSSEPHGDESFGGLKVSIGTNCAWDVDCFSVEFRFPYDYFNENATVKVPKPVYAYMCGRPVGSKDSVDVKAKEQFKVRFDSVTNNYIVTHDCYSPHNTICCGTRTRHHRYKVILPASIERKKSFYHLDLGSYNENREWVYRDTLIKEIRDTFFLQGVPETLFGQGFFYDDPLFLQEKFDDLLKEVILTDEGFYLYHEVKIPHSAYNPLNYKDTTVLVKLPLTMKKKEPGYYIEAFDYFIPLERKGSRKFYRQLLDFNFEYALYEKESDCITIVPSDKMRLHRKKRKARIKVKVKRHQ